METNNEYKYEVIKHFGNLSGYTNKAGVVCTKEVNKISYHDNEPVLDVRTWKRRPDGTVRMYKGLTLTNTEAKELLNILKDMENTGVI